MKRVNKSAVVPPLLDAYVQANPNDEWEQLKGNDRYANAQVKATLIHDQRGLCAYCEIDLAQYKGKGLDDFGVEHFHPKKRPPNPPPNHGLDWQNMLGVCSGGSSRDVGDPARFVQPRPKRAARLNQSCDVPKGGENWVGQILNPLNIPAFPPLFEFNESGVMSVSAECPPELQAQAQGSIDKLHLSPTPSDELPEPRLLSFRKAVLSKLAAELSLLVGQGMPLAAATKELAETFIPADPQQNWPAFFSAIRWYLGPAAEARLQAIQYNG